MLGKVHTSNLHHRPLCWPQQHHIVADDLSTFKLFNLSADVLGLSTHGARADYPPQHAQEGVVDAERAEEGAVQRHAEEPAHGVEL